MCPEDVHAGGRVVRSGKSVDRVSGGREGDNLMVEAQVLAASELAGTSRRSG